MKEGYIIRDQEKTHFITATVVDWIDVFTRKVYKDVVIESLAFCIKEKSMLLWLCNNEQSHSFNSTINIKI